MGPPPGGEERCRWLMCAMLVGCVLQEPLSVKMPLRGNKGERGRDPGQLQAPGALLWGPTGDLQGPQSLEHRSRTSSRRSPGVPRL